MYILHFVKFPTTVKAENVPTEIDSQNIKPKPFTTKES